MANFDDMKLAVESMTGGKNTVILDDMDMPSVMVAWPKQKLSAILAGGSDVIHPGSIVNGEEKLMYVGKYHNIVVNDRGYSLPLQNPRTSIDFDTALTACRNKKTDGGAWCLVPYALWCEIALWCRKNGTMPRGNNNYGKDHGYPHEVGIPVGYESATAASHAGEPNKCATGSGPATWNHNWLPDGIADLNGNINEWVAGMRLVDGQIQIIQNANVMDPEVSLAADSTYWKAINANGALVDTNATDTLKWDWVSSKLQLTKAAVTDTAGTNRSYSFTNMTLQSGLTAPELAKALLLYPDEPGGDYGGDYHYANMSGERLPLCGGAWNAAGLAGVFYVYLSVARSFSSGNFGFRSAFCEL